MTIAIVGAGYAGLAAAVELAAAGIAVDVFEASRTLGGRARRADASAPDGAVLDNGPHLLVGAYRQTLRLMARVGADAETLLFDHDLHLEYPGRLRLHAPDWPAPLHLAAALVGARGLDARDKLAAARFMLDLKHRRYRVEEELTVAGLLARHRQPPRVRRYLWEPLCLATLNTPPAAAAAQVFANVLRDTLGAGREDARLRLPRCDLSALFPEPAARYLESRGSRVLRGRRIGRVTRSEAGWRLDGEATPYRHVVLATAPHHLAPLLAPHAGLAGLTQDLARLRYEPIATVYLRYPPEVTLSRPLLGLSAEGEGHGQWLFDRGRLLGDAGLLAAVISADGPWRGLSHDELAAAVHGEIARQQPGLPAPLWQQVIVEKRATFACTPGLARLPTATPLPGLWLAGDHVAGDYPATLEGAVRSGIAAAQGILAAG